MISPFPFFDLFVGLAGIMQDDTCDICGEPFTDEEWDKRHIHGDISVHDYCEVST